MKLSRLMGKNRQILVALDVSGSMHQTAIEKIDAAVGDLIDHPPGELGNIVDMVAFDYDIVRCVINAKSPKDFKTLHEGPLHGGTNIESVTNFVSMREKQDTRYDVVLVFTDGYFTKSEIPDNFVFAMVGPHPDGFGPHIHFVE
jgi:predicted metal-dependent peptidase